MWAKYTAFELAHRAPMMIHVPGIIDQVNYDYYEKASNLYLLVNVFHNKPLYRHVRNNKGS